VQLCSLVFVDMVVIVGLIIVAVRASWCVLIWRSIGHVGCVCARLGWRAVRVSERAADGLVKRGAVERRRDAA
jgi:hypothetical protein